MANETVVAGSSPAEVEDVFGGQNVSMSEFSEYRKSGELPARFKPEEESTNDTPEETVESATEEVETESESESDDAQETPPKGSGAEKRIKQLLAEKKDLQRKLEQAAKKDVVPESSPAPAAQQQLTRPKPTPEDKKPDGSPKYATYEDYVEELADFKAEQRWAAAQREQVVQAQQKALGEKLDEARERYDNFDEVSKPFVSEFVADQKIAPVVKHMVSDSPVFADLVFTLAEDDKFMAIARNEPGKAIRYIAKVESLIQEEQSKAGEEELASGKTPEKKKTAAPKPPAPVGGTNSRAFDVSDESLSPEEWARKRNADRAKRGK